MKNFGINSCAHANTRSILFTEDCYFYQPKQKMGNMNLRQSVPDYLTTRKNTIIQVAFTTVFAYIFINIYRPFGYDDWYKISGWQLMIASAMVVVAGMLVVLLSRILFFQLKKNHEITYALYAWFIAAEIFFMGAFYTSLEIWLLNDQRSPVALMFNAIQNTALILLIPYALSFLFFSRNDIKKRLEQAVAQFREPSELFIPFRDEKGNLKITIRSSDVLYLESNDNYVNIHYRDKEKRKVYMIRSSLKQYEQELKDYPIWRNHRKFSVNVQNIQMMVKAPKGYELVLNSPGEEHLPVSRSYEKKIMQLLHVK